MSGVELVRQYYLRVVSARDGSPAAKAGLRTGDFIRAIDDKPTRDMSAYEGARLLRGAPGSKVTLLVFRGNAADPHEVTLVARAHRRPGADVADGERHDRLRAHRRLHARSRRRESSRRSSALAKTGATRYVIDLRGTARGDLDDGRRGGAPVRASGHAGREADQGSGARWSTAARQTARVIAAPVALLVDQGTAGAAEVFAAALDGNDRAELVGERTLGRAARQRS